MHKQEETIQDNCTFLLTEANTLLKAGGHEVITTITTMTMTMKMTMTMTITIRSSYITMITIIRSLAHLSWLRAALKDFSRCKNSEAALSAAQIGFIIVLQKGFIIVGLIIIVTFNFHNCKLCQSNLWKTSLP